MHRLRTFAFLVINAVLRYTSVDVLASPAAFSVLDACSLFTITANGLWSEDVSRPNVQSPNFSGTHRTSDGSVSIHAYFRSQRVNFLLWKSIGGPFHMRAAPNSYWHPSHYMHSGNDGSQYACKATFTINCLTRSKAGQSYWDKIHASLC